MAYTLIADRRCREEPVSEQTRARTTGVPEGGFKHAVCQPFKYCHILWNRVPTRSGTHAGNQLDTICCVCTSAEHVRLLRVYIFCALTSAACVRLPHVYVCWTCTSVAHVHLARVSICCECMSAVCTFAVYVRVCTSSVCVLHSSVAKDKRCHSMIHDYILQFVSWCFGTRLFI
mgnify:CR=1 FL=1